MDSSNNHWADLSADYSISLKAFACHLNAMTITILTAGALKEGVACAADKFMAAGGGTVAASFTHGSDIRDGILAGAMEAHILGLPTAMMDALAAKGLLANHARLSVGSIRVGVAIKSGDAAPDLTSLAALKAAMAAAIRLIYTTAPSGEYMAGVIEDLGLTDALAAKTMRFGTGGQVNDHLAGPAPTGALAFGVSTEITFYRDKGVVLAGYLPPEIESSTPYQIARHAAAPPLADEFFDYLGGDQARALFAASGVE